MSFSVMLDILKKKEKNKNCLLCKGISEYKDDEYLEALAKFLEKERMERYERE